MYADEWLFSHHRPLWTHCQEARFVNSSTFFFLTFFFFPSFPAPENLQLAWLESCLGNFTKALTLIAKNDLEE